MGGWFDDWREKMKKTFVFKAAKTVGRTTGKIAQYGGAPVGNFFFGPLGGIVGTGVGMIGGQIGPNKDRGSQLQRDAIYGGAWTATTAAISLATGGGLSSSLYKSGAAIFGGGEPAPAQVGSGYGSDELVTMGNSPSGGSPSALATAAQAAATRAGGGNTAQLEQQYQEQLALAAKLRAQGDTAGALLAEAQAEAYRQMILAQGGTPGGGGFDLTPLLIGGAAILGLFLLFKK